MRTTLILIALGIAVALVAVVSNSPTSADRVVGPETGTLASARFADGAGLGAMILTVKDGNKHHGNFKGGGHNHWRHNRHDRWYGYPGYGWDSETWDADFKTCVWNGYSYTCYKKSDPY
jgi:hypothetical protein